MDKIGDEYHYLFECTDDDIITARNTFLPKFYRIRPNMSKFNLLFNKHNVKLLKKLVKFCIIINERVSPPG